MAKAKKKAKKKSLTPKQAVALIKRQSEIIIREFDKVKKEELRDFKAVRNEHLKNLKLLKNLVAETQKNKIKKIAKLRRLVKQGKDVNLDKL